MVCKQICTYMYITKTRKNITKRYASRLHNFKKNHIQKKNGKWGCIKMKTREL